MREQRVAMEMVAQADKDGEGKANVAWRRLVDERERTYSSPCRMEVEETSQPSDAKPSITGPRMFPHKSRVTVVIPFHSRDLEGDGMEMLTPLIHSSFKF